MKVTRNKDTKIEIDDDYISMKDVTICIDNKYETFMFYHAQFKIDNNGKKNWSITSTFNTTDFERYVKHQPNFFTSIPNQNLMLFISGISVGVVLGLIMAK